MGEVLDGLGHLWATLTSGQLHLVLEWCRVARIHIGAGDGESVKTGRCSISVPPSEVDSVPVLAVASPARRNNDLFTVSKKKWVLVTFM